jgi:hypothetical protein
MVVLGGPLGNASFSVNARTVKEGESKAEQKSGSWLGRTAGSKSNALFI